ncbi:MAG TPA: galactose-1-phosphate uridylyltransferase [Actinomycetota bacterium]
MSTLRQDPTTKDWVILAPRRAGRPHRPPEPGRAAPPERDPECSFCPGNEDRTPPEILRVPEGSPWRVRVFPNLFPAVGHDGDGRRDGVALFREMQGRGEHEVVVESPRHDARLDEMSHDEVTDVLRVWRERYRRLARRSWVRAVIVFKNFGPGAGTSLAHPHSQIVAIPVFPASWLRRFAVAIRYYDDTGHNLYDDMIDAERAAASRVVAERGRFLAFEPYASRTPFETTIMPAVHQSSFSQLTDEDTGDLARLLHDVTGALREAAGDPDYNLVVTSAPADDLQRRLVRWHVQILPKLALPAGFELGTGMNINPVMPEEAADALREALARREATRKE